MLKRLFGGSPASVSIKLALASVVVGLVLSLLHIEPQMLWLDFFGAIADAWAQFWGLGWSALVSASQYLLMGAVIVVPIWLAFRLARAVFFRDRTTEGAASAEPAPPKGS